MICINNRERASVRIVNVNCDYPVIVITAVRNKHNYRLVRVCFRVGFFSGLLFPSHFFFHLRFLCVLIPFRVGTTQPVRLNRYRVPPTRASSARPYKYFCSLVVGTSVYLTVKTETIPSKKVFIKSWVLIVWVSGDLIDVSF